MSNAEKSNLPSCVANKTSLVLPSCIIFSKIFETLSESNGAVTSSNKITDAELFSHLSSSTNNFSPSDKVLTFLRFKSFLFLSPTSISLSAL